MSKIFYFFIDDQEIQKSLDFDQLSIIPKQVRDSLFQEGEYILKSKVRPQIFQFFLNYLIDNNQIPEITVDNIYEYHLLTEEFNFKSDLLSKDEYNDLYKLSILLNSIHNSNTDKSSIEEYISQNLDYYINNFSNEMYKITPESLYNIFINENRVLNNHDRAYQFIISSDQNLCVLIQSLDAIKLSEPILKDAITKKDEHFGFIPKNSFSYFTILSEKVSSFDSFLNQTINEFKDQVTQVQQQYNQVNSNLQKEINELNQKVDNLKSENVDLKSEISNQKFEIDQLQRNDEENNKQLISFLNDITVKVQQNMIQRMIKNSINQNKLQFFSAVNEFILFLLNLKLPSDKIFFEFQYNKFENEDQYSIYILHPATKFIYDNKLFTSQKFRKKIQLFKKVYFEFLYSNDDSFKIYENISNMKKDKDLIEIVQIGIFITGVPLIKKEYLDKFNLIKYAKIDSNISSIEDGSFNKCIMIERIIIPSSVKSIGVKAFENCSSLREIFIPFGVNKISNGLFSGCTSLDCVIIPYSVSVIENESFSGCSKLMKISIPSNVIKIKKKTFAYCSSLTQIEIPESVISIDDFAFEGCSSLTQIEIPESVTSIDDFAFVGCSSLTQIKIPSSITSIKGIFKNCTSLKTILLPSSLISIGDDTFNNCSSLDKIVIPSKVKSIGYRAFKDCTSLTKIILPSSLKEIDAFAFCECSSLKQIEIPSSVTSIGPRAFYECSSLSQIKIPSSITNIEPNTFYGCKLRDKNLIPQPSFDVPSSTTIDDFKQIKKMSNYKFRAVDKKTGQKVCIIDSKIYNWNDLFSYFKKVCINVQGFLKINGFYSNYDDYYYKYIYFVFTDFMKNGDVKTIMKEYLDSKGTTNYNMNPTIRSKIIFGVASIMKHLHRKGFIHLNLTNTNVFLDDNFEPIIGLPQFKLFNDDEDNYDPPFNFDKVIFLPPELLNSDRYSLSADVYSYGIFLYFMFATKIEFQDRDRGPNLIYKITRGLRPKMPENIPKCFQELITACWNDNIENRPTFDLIVNELKDDKYAINEFGLTTNLDLLHEYQNRIDSDE